MKLSFCCVLLVITAVIHAAEVNWPVVRSLERCNVTWDSPSGDSFGSMPLGNGDIGLNIWVENSGDLVFYISKVDAFDAGHLLQSLGVCA